MNAPVTIKRAKLSLADDARAIVRSTHFELAPLKPEAQAYLDNLAEGVCLPDDLILALARCDARHEYRGKDWLFDDWFDRNRDDFILAVKLLYGFTLMPKPQTWMERMEARPAESYVPAMGGAA